MFLFIIILSQVVSFDYSSYSLLPHYINFAFSGLILNVTPRLCLKQRKKIYSSKRIIKEPMTSECSYSSISLSLPLKSFLSIIHHIHCFQITLIFFFFFIVLYFQILPYNKEKKIYSSFYSSNLITTSEY